MFPLLNDILYFSDLYPCLSVTFHEDQILFGSFSFAKTHSSKISYGTLVKEILDKTFIFRDDIDRYKCVYKLIKVIKTPV